MIKIENTEVYGFEAAIRGMRNPMNSWEKSDSRICSTYAVEEGCRFYGRDDKCSHWKDCDNGILINDAQIAHIGPNDLYLMKRLRNAGSDHRKFMRMITVYLDITAPLYWWKEFKTYRAGRKNGNDEPGIINEEYLECDIEMNSCSTMHKIHEKEFTFDDFSHEHLIDDWSEGLDIQEEDYEDCYNGFSYAFIPQDILRVTINMLNRARDLYLQTKNKKYWWQMIQLLPSSYNQKRTIMMNYEVLANIYGSRRGHKLDEWNDFCEWIKTLPYSELITGCE